MTPQALDSRRRDFTLSSIMSEHTKTITAISWSPYDPDLIATAAADGKVIVWSVGAQAVVAALNDVTPTPCSVGWMGRSGGEGGSADVVFLSGRGPLQMYV